MNADLLDFSTSNFERHALELIAEREFFEFVWRDLKPTLGIQNQDLIDLYFLASLVRNGDFDCIVEVGRGGGTVTSIVYRYRRPDAQFISICPQTTFLQETLPALRDRYQLPDNKRSKIIEGLLQEVPLARSLSRCGSILLLFDGDHTSQFARFYLERVVLPLAGRRMLVGVHDIYSPAIQPLTRPNQWDDPKGPFFAGGLACRWDEVLAVMDFVQRHRLPYMHTGTWYRENIACRSDSPEYLKDISTVKVPPYSSLWPFDGQAGTWLFVDASSLQPPPPLWRAAGILRDEVEIKGRAAFEASLRTARDGANRLVKAAASVAAGHVPRPSGAVDGSDGGDPDLPAIRALTGADPAASEAASQWYERRREYLRRADSASSPFRYLDLVARHAAESPQAARLLALFSLALSVRPRRIVEFGSAFTLYPKHVESAWSVSTAADEGMISTRVLLSACAVLESLGVESNLASVDVREQAFYDGSDVTHSGEQLFSQLGLRKYWQPSFGLDSVEWLRLHAPGILSGSEPPIDFAFIDSSHTYTQVSAELAGLEPLMSRSGLIVVDNCYVLADVSHQGFFPDETSDGASRGGEFGAIVDFLEAHPGWRAQWGPASTDLVYMRFGATDEVRPS
jgi:hypothetical protein